MVSWNRPWGPDWQQFVICSGVLGRQLGKGWPRSVSDLSELKEIAWPDSTELKAVAWPKLRLEAVASSVEEEGGWVVASRAIRQRTVI